jgi:hypothetical protein
MRVWFLVYGVLYVVIEMVGYQLELVGWPQITALDVATALTNALLGVAVAAAVLVAMDLLVRRWRRSLEAWEQERTNLAEELWQDQQPIGVRSWRSGRPALPVGSSALPGPADRSLVRPYGERSYAAHASAGGTYADRSSGELEGHLL